MIFDSNFCQCTSQKVSWFLWKCTVLSQTRTWHGVPKDKGLGIKRIFATFEQVTNNTGINDMWKFWRCVLTLTANVQNMNCIKNIRYPIFCQDQWLWLHTNTLFRKTSHFHCGLFQRKKQKVGWQKRGIPTVSLFTISVGQNILIL